jgi:hypothetical protein
VLSVEPDTMQMQCIISKHLDQKSHTTAWSHCLPFCHHFTGKFQALKYSCKLNFQSLFASIFNSVFLVSKIHRFRFEPVQNRFGEFKNVPNPEPEPSAWFRPRPEPEPQFGVRTEVRNRTFPSLLIMFQQVQRSQVNSHTSRNGAQVKRKRMYKE